MIYTREGFKKKCENVLDKYLNNKDFKIKEYMEFTDTFTVLEAFNELFDIEINEIHVECFNREEYTIKRKTRMQYEMNGKTYMAEHIDHILKENGGVKKVVPSWEVINK